MSFKKADFNYINKETTEFLGKEFKFDSKNFGDFKKREENMKVELLFSSNFKEWLKAMYFTAFASWNNGYEINLEKILEETRQELTLSYLKKRPISAVLESAIFVIKIDNITRALATQLTRHRNASFNQESFRVVPAHHADFRIPDDISEKELFLLKETVNATRELYVKLIEEGIPIEQARNVLGMGTCTHIVATMNLKTLKDYIKARTLDITQDEHTFLVCKMAQELKQEAPEFYVNFIQTEELEKLMEKYL